MKRYLLMLLLVAGCTRQPGETGTQLVGPAEFESMIQRDAILIDVRTPEEFQRGFIDGAINMNYKADDFETRVDSLDKSKKYLIYCASGVRSGKASDLMKKKGFKSIVTLEGGIEAWIAADRPVVTK